MAVVSKNVLKGFFTPGSIPTSQQFDTLIDSTVSFIDDRYVLGLKNYDPTLIYVAGDTVIYNQLIYQANTTTVPGAFNINNWNKIAGGLPGSVTYKGTWDASANVPDLNTAIKNTGDYYVVSVAGNTVLNSPPNEISDWQAGDWAIYNSTLWEKIDNSDAITDAANVTGSGAGLYDGKNGTVLEFKRMTNSDGSILINEGAAVDLGIQFGDSGISANRPWSAYKTNNELNSKQPLLGYTAEDEANKITAFTGTPGDTEYPSAKLVFDQLALKQSNLGYTAENEANKVIAFQATPDNVHYPSEKLVADQLALKQNLLGYTAENVANKVNTFQVIPDYTHYPSEKLVADQLNLKQDNLGYTAENEANKVITFQTTPDNVHYPSEKLVADQLALKQNVLGYTAENSANRVSTFQSNPDNAHYPSEKLVADQLNLKQDNLGYTAEDEANKVMAFQATPDNVHYPSEKLVADQLALKQNVLGYIAENSANRLSTFQITPDNVHYPSEKLVADQLALKQNNLGYTAENISNKVIAFQATPDNVHYPSEKLVADKFATLSNVQNTKVNFIATVDPSVTNDSTQGYSVGSTWVNTVSKNEFVCVNAIAGAAVWKVTTITLSVFGNDYNVIETTTAATTSTSVFQNYTALTLNIAAGTLNGNYRIQWTCMVTNNSKQGEFRFVDNTVPASPVVLGPSILYQANGNSDVIPLGGVVNVSIAGVSKQYLIQFRAVGASGTETLKGGRIEIFRIS